MLNRFNGNVEPFAVNATATNRTIFGDVTQSDDIDDNLNADFKTGWEIVGVNDNPTKQDFNALAYTLGNLISYLYQQGIAVWNINQKYYTGSRCIGSNDLIYKALTGTEPSPNTGNDPVSDAVNWKQVSDQNIGVDQTWQNLTVSRAIGVTYTNTTGKPISVKIYFSATTTSVFSIELQENGTLLDKFTYDPDSANAEGFSVSAIIPAGSTYSIISTGTVAMAKWSELR